MQPQITPQSFGELAGWRLAIGNASVEITAQGAQILSYQQAEQPPIIWLSEQAEFNLEQSARGGIPICWPWFGAIERNPQAVQQMTQPDAPFHGLARQKPWQLISQFIEQDRVGLVLALNTKNQPLAEWPHAALLQLSVTLTAHQLQLQLSTTNLGQQPIHISQALHSYFAVSDIQQVSVQGFADCAYIETLEDWQIRQQAGAITFNGETDRIYLQPAAEIQLIDPVWQRKIQLSTSNSHSAVVWNPWTTKAQQLSQFADDTWQRMLCIETANIWDDCIELTPQAEHQLTLAISASGLD